MKRNPILLMFLAILVTQPLLIVGFGPTLATNAITADDTVVLSQGTRLTTHTAHVPILIDGNADFVTQGWPGAGSPASPYIISGLNITYNLGIPAIQVYNADVSFIIRDCYIDQNSDQPGIEFLNTTAGTIEYTTVYSEGTGIRCDNANNTEIWGSYIQSNSDSGSVWQYVLDMDDSISCHMENNIFKSTDYRCAWIDYCHNYESINNIYTGAMGWFHVTLNYCNNTSFESDILITGETALRFFNCFNANVDGIEISDMTRGVLFENSPNSVISESTMVVTNEYGVSIIGSDNVEVSACTINGEGIYSSISEWLTITGNTLSNSANFGILLSGAHNSTVTLNTVTDTIESGIHIEASYDCEVSSNTISACDSSGIYVDGSHRLVMDGNVISDTGDDGLYITLSDNGTVGNSIIETVTNDGIELDDCNNWQAHDNTITDANVGITIYQGSFTDIWSNDISHIDQEGINANTHGVLETWENTVTDAETGLYYTDCDDLYIRDETVSDCVTGIFVDQSEESEFSNNDVTDCTYSGIYMWELANTSFIGNTITNCIPYGFYVEISTNLTFTDNELTGGGFYFPVDSSIDEINHTFSGNTVNDLPLYYGIEEEDIDIDGTTCGQIILIECQGAEVTGGSFMYSAAIFLYTSANVNISSVVITDHVFGIAVLYSENVTIRDSSITGNYDWSNVGILAVYSDWLTVENVDITTSEEGIVVSYSDYAIIDSCTLYDSAELIYCEGSTGGIIVDSDISYAGDGIYLESSLWWNISRNNIYWCEFGMETDYADFMNMSLNDFHDCYVGAYHFDTYDSIIYNNTFRWNEYGFVMESCSSGPIMYYNIFLNFNENGYDDSSNDWDNWIDTGNYWHDYGGSGPYPVDGGVAYDNYPMVYAVTEPIINDAYIESYAEGTTGHSATWYAYDDYLSDYTVTIDGAPWTSDIVPDLYLAEIVVNIDGLAYGEHTIIITVWDIDLNSVSDTGLIDVYDNTNPIINHPPNFEIFYGVTGNEIVWEVLDLNPDNYVVMMDGSEFATGSWTSGTLSVGIDGLSVGVHNFMLTIFDADENSAYDSISILVINDATGPTIDSPDDLVFVVGTTGNRIIWTPTDDYPDRFEVAFNGTVIAADSWGGGHIVFELDNLVVGDYNFTLTVFDGGQHSVSDTVAVEVIPYEGWTPVLPPPDFTLLIIAGVGITGAIVVIGVIYYLKVKKSGSGGA